MSLYSEGQWRWVCERYNEGYSLWKLSEFLDLCPQTVCNCLKKYGVKTRPGRPLTKEQQLLPDLEGRKHEFYALVFAR